MAPWGGGDSWDRFPVYVSADERRHRAVALVKEAEKRVRLAENRALAPVAVEPKVRAIVRSFWGKSWIENLERYADLATRLPRGRNYLRTGAVADLAIAEGRVEAWVAGSALYRVTVTFRPLLAARWQALRKESGGRVDSLVALLSGELPDAVMAAVTRAGTGLFPEPREIAFDCSCPDHAHMCKHVAAVLYGVGVRLDTEPALLFRLRAVDAKELVASDTVDLLTLRPPSGRVLPASRLASIFGIKVLPEKPAAKTTKKRRAASKPKRPTTSRPSPRKRRRRTRS